MLGQLDLAAVPGQLPGRDAMRASVLQAADRIIAVQTAPHIFGREVRDAIVSSMLEFSGGAALKDDVTIVVARIV